MGLDYSYRKIDVFEVDDNGNIIENYSWNAYEINDAIDDGRNIIQHGWQERLFEPRWDFEQEKWVEGLSDEEVQQREQERLEQENKPSETDVLAMAVM
ncbi:MAG TPA: hypothetical protein VLA13_06520, partial [Massilibacterium sp.]|nr:hypothetical protein [Massilibacterium sp.]